jgi:DNA-binding transcriptional LysR family regulator
VQPHQATKEIGTNNFSRRLDLQYLAVFEAIAETRSLWKAADRLDLSPSTVSQHLASLEKIAGQRLVERTRGSRQVALTDAGRLFVRHAQTILAHVRATQADLEAFATGTTGSLKVGIYQSIGSRVLPRLLPRFVRRWPAIEVQLVEGLPDSALLLMLAAGELDLTFTTFPVKPGPFEAARLLEDPYVLAIAADSPLPSSRRPVSVSDLRDYKLLGAATCQSELEERFRTLGVQPTVWFPSSDNAVIQSLVANGVGAAIGPMMTFDPADKRIRISAVQGLRPRLLGLAWHAGRHFLAPVEDFRTTAQTVCLELESEWGRVLPHRNSSARSSAGASLPKSRYQDT